MKRAIEYRSRHLDWHASMTLTENDPTLFKNWASGVAEIPKPQDRVVLYAEALLFELFPFFGFTGDSNHGIGRRVARDINHEFLLWRLMEDLGAKDANVKIEAALLIAIINKYEGRGARIVCGELMSKRKDRTLAEMLLTEDQGIQGNLLNEIVRQRPMNVSGSNRNQDVSARRVSMDTAFSALSLALVRAQQEGHLEFIDSLFSSIEREARKIKDYSVLLGVEYLDLISTAVRNGKLGKGHSRATEWLEKINKELDGYKGKAENVIQEIDRYPARHAPKTSADQKTDNPSSSLNDTTVKR